eukprot:7267636-Lingulodinium_polyedra.AAC.1
MPTGGACAGAASAGVSAAAADAGARERAGGPGAGTSGGHVGSVLAAKGGADERPTEGPLGQGAA